MSKPTYEYLEAQVKQLEADNEKAMSVLKEANDAVLLAKSKFEALAAENAGLKEAMRVTLEHVSVMDTGQAEVRAQGVEKAIAHLENKFSNIGVQIMNLQWLADSLRGGNGE